MLLKGPFGSAVRVIASSVLEPGPSTSPPVSSSVHESVPEPLVVVGALIAGGKELGLSAEQTKSLTTLMTDAYAKIATDGAFRKTPSALPYCFETTRPTEGHYFLYRPAKVPEKPL